MTHKTEGTGRAQDEREETADIALARTTKGAGRPAPFIVPICLLRSLEGRPESWGRVIGVRADHLVVPHGDRARAHR